MPLLATKLYIPSVRPALVPRPRLIEQLDKGLAHRLVLVSAPAGFGKTTLLTEWINASHVPAAWVSLDEGDNDPARFLAYVIAALQTVEGSIGNGVLEALQSRQPLSMEELVTALINQIQPLPASLTLVLDDYHLITALPIHQALEFLLDHLPRNLHLVIATRSDPPLPIARLRGRGQLVELRQNDLRFTPGESMQFLNQVMGLKIEAEDAAALARRTEGWVTGLQMAALSMQKDEDVHKFIAEFTGSQHYILDYLIEEVLQRQPEHLQSFLLQTSILDRMTGPLCDSLLGAANSHTVLETLEHANLFVVPLDDQQRWYRYHHLFADLLRHRLNEVYPGQEPILHRRASEWHERNGQMAEAIEYALAAQDLERAANLIEQTAEATLMRSQVATFETWIEALPDDLVRARPSLLAYHAWTLLLSGHPLSEAKAHLEEVGPSDVTGPAAGVVTAFRALFAAYEGESRTSLELARQAQELLPETNRFLTSALAGFVSLNHFWRGDVVAARQSLEKAVQLSQKAGNLMNTVLAMCHLGEICLLQGQIHQARSLFDQALALTFDTHGRRQPIAGYALIGLGRVLREWNELEAAARYFKEGVELMKQWGEVGAVNGYVGLAYIKQAQGDAEGARALMHKAQQVAARFEVTKLSNLIVSMNQARLSLLQDNLDVALAWVEARGLGGSLGEDAIKHDIENAPSPWLRMLELMTLAQVRLAQGQPGQADRILDLLIPIAEQADWGLCVIYLLWLQALARWSLGNLPAAMALAQRVMALAEPQGMVRSILDEGKSAHLLMQDFRHWLEKQPHAESRQVKFADTLLAAFQADKQAMVPPPLEPASAAPQLVEPLSERELEILRLLTTDLATTDMADELCVSVNTVRTHIRSIYGKLGVHTRYEAIARAQELALFQRKQASNSTSPA